MSPSLLQRAFNFDALLLIRIPCRFGYSKSLSWFVLDQRLTILKGDSKGGRNDRHCEEYGFEAHVGLLDKMVEFKLFRVALIWNVSRSLIVEWLNGENVLPEVLSIMSFDPVGKGLAWFCDTKAQVCPRPVWT